VAYEELASFRMWFVEFDAASRNREAELDVAGRRLDALADWALASRPQNAQHPTGCTEAAKGVFSSQCRGCFPLWGTAYFPPVPVERWG